VDSDEDAFSPRFCDGSTQDRTQDGGCREDKGGGEGGARSGLDCHAARITETTPTTARLRTAIDEDFELNSLRLTARFRF